MKNYDELVKTAPALSLMEQGWIDKPSAPMIMMNGEKDAWISPREIQLLLEHGEPKTARLIPDGAHLGRFSTPHGRRQPEHHRIHPLPPERMMTL